MAQDERGVTLLALVASLLGVLFILFANFFVVYTLKLLTTGRVPVGRYGLVTLGTLLSASPFYWLYRRYQLRQAQIAALAASKFVAVPDYSERDRQLVLELIEQQGRVTLQDVTALTGLNTAQGEALLASLGATPKTQPQPAPADKPILNAEGENPFDVDLSS